MNRLSAVVTLAIASGACSAQAATSLGDDFSLSGFGTLGGVVSDSDEAQYVSGFEARGATRSPSLLVDSKLGLQLTGQANDWLSGTVQVVTAQRTEPRLTTRVDWAFVKVVPLDGLSVRAGKFSIPNFLVSDSRQVGYANNWLRAPNEVYGLDLLNGGLKGADASYRVALGGNSATATALYGDSSYTQTNDRLVFKLHHVAGLNVVWDGGWYTFRVGHIEGKPDLSVQPLLAGFLAPGVPLAACTYKFTGYGLTVDRADVVLQAEYVLRRLTHLDEFAGGNGWYVLGGYRIDRFLPYLEVAATRPTPDAALFQPAQRTRAVGLRWDAFSSAALKFQLERVDPRGTGGISFVTSAPSVTRAVTTLSAALDFVF
jgi:hypothetical protein